MVRCHVKGCHRSQTKDKNHHFFSEPANLMIRKQWREFCNIEGISKDVRICSDHFHGTCFRKKTPPRPLLVPGAVPTIPPVHQKPPKIQHSNFMRQIEAIEQNEGVKYDQLTLENNDPKKLNTDVIEFMRPALPHECLRNSKTIIVDIEKATESTPATVHIQTNSKIRVVMSDETDCEDIPISQDQCSWNHASGNNDLTVGLDLFSETKTTTKISPLKEGNSCTATSLKYNSLSNLKLSKNQQPKSAAILSQKKKQNLKLQANEYNYHQSHCE